MAGIFFGTWLLLALAIADFPPPPGFVILVMILLACALNGASPARLQLQNLTPDL
ncbi:MAG: hypothetical protein WBG92_01680 [Thiohalocapsa sp.]